MSHSVASLQRMSWNQVAHIAAHSSYSIDRTRAQQELERRRRIQQQNNAYNQRQQNLINDLQNRINNMTNRESHISQALTTAQRNIETMNRNHAAAMQNMRNNFSREMQERDRQHQSELVHLSQQADLNLAATRQELQAQFNNRIQRSQEEMDRRMQTIQNNMQEQVNIVTRGMTEQINQVQSNVRTLDQRMNQLISLQQSREAQEQEMLRQAQEYLSGADSVIESIASFNTHNWCQTELNDIKNRRRGVTMNIETGVTAASAARLAGFELFENALVYQEHVLAAEREWQIAYEMTEEIINQAEVFLDESSTITMGDQEIDVDYWTCGDLSRIRSGLAEIHQQLSSPTLTREQMEGLRDLALMYQEQIHQTVLYAQQAADLSHGRRILMNHAIRLLTKPGSGFMRLEWAEYFHGDPRLGYRAYLVDSDGTRVVITAELLNEGDVPGNQFRSEILSYGTNIHNADQATEYNNRLLARLKEGTTADFGTPSCSMREHVVPDSGQSNLNLWKTPSQEQIDQATNRVGYHPSPAVEQQMQQRRRAAGL